MKPLKGRSLFTAVAAAAVVIATSLPALAQVTSASIASALSSSNYINLNNAVISTRTIAPLYAQRANQPIFFNGASPTASFAALRTLLQQLHTFGLDRGNYINGQADALTSQIGNGQNALHAELLFAQALVEIASDLATGRAALLAVDNETDFRKAKFEQHQLLNQIVNSGNFVSGLAQLEPQHREYQDLKQALAKLHSIKANGGWKSISGSSTLRPGATSADVPGIRQRLADLNYLPAADRNNASTTYDRGLVDAVKRFQAAMKLDADGICGRGCFGALKPSIDQRLNQMNVNLERWRWLPKSLGTKHIFVNLARQELKVRENGVDVIQMKTVNGRLLRRTPTMVDKVYEIILNPYWTAPNSIAIKDLIPSQIRDPNYFASSYIRVLDRNRMEIDPYTVNWSTIGNNVPYTLRQDPGPHNSLGTMKFSLTNSRAIYLHDTPHPEDFPNVTRLKSSGCVRLERPAELAEYLLRGTEWDSFRIQDVVYNYMTYPAHSIRLAQPVPTYLTYLTASVGEQGEIQFTPDYYGQDQRLINVIQNPNREGF